MANSMKILKYKYVKGMMRKYHHSLMYYLSTEPCTINTRCIQTCTTNMVNTIKHRVQFNSKHTHRPQHKQFHSEKNSEVNLSIQDNGRLVSVKWSDGLTSNFHSVWLRHNCQCSHCLHDSSGQRIFDNTVSHQTTLHSAEIIDSVVYLKWSEEANHTGHVSLEYLKDNNYSSHNIQHRHSAVKIKEIAKEFPVVKYNDVMTDRQALYRWLYLINEYGLCLMKGVPLDETLVGSVAEKIGPIQETNYGKTFDVKADPNPVNIAYSSVALDLHMDLVYLESPPGLQLLHCIRFDDCIDGGESTYLDLFHVVEEFRKCHPKLFEALIQIPATFHKCHYERENPFHLVYQKPHIMLNNYHEIIAVNWAPPFEGPLLVEEVDVLRYYEAYEELANMIKNTDKLLTYTMQSGDLMTFNNHRILHGRKSFALNGGIRHFVGCYVCIDDFKCKVQVLSNEVGDGRAPKHVCNQSWL